MHTSDTFSTRPAMAREAATFMDILGTLLHFKAASRAYVHLVDSFEGGSIPITVSTMTDVSLEVMAKYDSTPLEYISIIRYVFLPAVNLAVSILCRSYLALSRCGVLFFELDIICFEMYIFDSKAKIDSFEILNYVTVGYNHNKSVADRGFDYSSPFRSDDGNYFHKKSENKMFKL